MKVYVVQEGYMGGTGIDCDGGGPLAVFSTKEAAVAYCRALDRDANSQYGRYWSEVEVDSIPQAEAA